MKLLKKKGVTGDKSLCDRDGQQDTQGLQGPTFCVRISARDAAEARSGNPRANKKPTAVCSLLRQGTTLSHSDTGSYVPGIGYTSEGLDLVKK